MQKKQRESVHVHEITIQPSHQMCACTNPHHLTDLKSSVQEIAECLQH